MLIDVLFFYIIFIFSYRLYLVIVKEEKKRHNDIRMLSLLSSHYTRVTFC